MNRTEQLCHNLCDKLLFAWQASQGLHFISTKYGTLTVNPDGTYSYTLNNDSSEVQRLSEGQSKVETFEVTVTDTWGANSSQTITVTINGSNDTPVINISSGDFQLKESGVGAKNDPAVD